MNESPNNPMQIIRDGDLKYLYGLAPTTVRGWEQKGLIRPRRRFGARNTGWFRGEFEEDLRSMGGSAA